MKEYSTVFLDWDGTLCLQRFWEHWATERAEDFALIQGNLFGGEPTILHRWMRGRLDAETVVDTIRKSANELPVDTLAHLQRNCEAMTFHHPDVVDLIQRARNAGFRVVIATDNMDTFPRWTMPTLGLKCLVDDVLDSWTLGACKCDQTADGSSAFFGRFLEANVVDPTECILIDDSEEICTVRKFGIDVYKIDRGQDIQPILKSIIARAD